MGTTWLTRPKWSASSADRKLPVKLISRARRTPIACGSSTVRPHPGITPTRVWVSPNLACSEATRKSQLRASSNPPVTATPLTAPISGLATCGNGPRVPVDVAPPSAPLPATEVAADEPSSLRSSPAQNAGSAPVRINTSTSSRASASCITSGSRRSSSLDSALRALGRLSVIVAMRSVTSRRTGRRCPGPRSPGQCRRRWSSVILVGVRSGRGVRPGPDGPCASSGRPELTRCCRLRRAGTRSAGRRGARASTRPSRPAPRSARRATSWCRRPASPRPARRGPRR